MHNEEDDSLKKRLQRYQEEPEEDTWDKIRSDLPGDRIAGQRLTMYEEQPDDRVWSNIRQSLFLNRNAKRLEWIANTAAVVSLLLLMTPSLPGNESVVVDSKHVTENRTIEIPSQKIPYADSASESSTGTSRVRKEDIESEIN